MENVKIRPFREQWEETCRTCPYQTVQVEGGSFRYTRKGNPGKKTLVFLNGGTNMSEMWFPYLTDLSDTFQVLLFDYSSDYPDNQALVEGMHSLFEALDIREPVLIGASFGGMCAQLYTQRYPEEVGALILIATGGMDAKTMRSMRLQFLAASALAFYLKHCNYEKMKPKLINMGCQHAKNETAEIQAYVREMFTVLFRDYTKEKDVHMTGLMADFRRQTPVTKETFRSLAGKILLILPSVDYFSPQMQKDLIELMNEPETCTIEGGHLSTVLRAPEFIAEIRKFLQKL